MNQQDDFDRDVAGAEADPTSRLSGWEMAWMVVVICATSVYSLGEAAFYRVRRLWRRK